MMKAMDGWCDRWRARLATAAVAAFTASSADPALAQQRADSRPQLPAITRWATYEPGSMGHLQASALASAIKARNGLQIVVLANASDLARHALLAQGKADFIMSGLGSFFAQEGLFAFAQSGQGPQEVRLVLGAWSNNIAFATAGGSGITALADLKGKRVGVIGGRAANAHVALSLLDSAGLAWRDVKRVELGSLASGPEALLMNKADAVLELTGTTAAHMIAGGPRGVHWLPVPHGSEAIWKRLAVKAPFLVRRVDATGAGILPGRPVEGAAYPYPILVTRPATAAPLVQAMAGAVIDGASSLMGSVPGIDGWDISRQRLDWVIPLHDGAIAWAKAKGLWTAELQARNDRLVLRQKVLKEAWAEAKAQAKPDTTPADAQRIWLFHRNRRLGENGLEPFY